MEIICKNCEAENQIEFTYCPQCGQKTQLHRLSLHDIVHEAIHYFTHADKGLFQLIRDLVIKRGKVAKQFVEGKRKKFYPPLTFFLLVIAMNVFVSTKTDDHVNVDIQKKYPEVNSIKNPEQRAEWIAIYERREKGIHFVNTNVNTISMISLPIIALIFWLFYRRLGYNYVEHLVAGMYMFGFYTLLTMVISLTGYLFKVNENLIYGICLPLQVVYYTLFYGSFISGRYLRAFFASFLSILLLFFISGMLMWVYMFMIR